MAIRILACFCIAASFLLAADFQYFPVNTCEQNSCTHGLSLYFMGAEQTRAKVTVTALQNGKPATLTQVIDTTHRQYADPVFYMMIDEAGRHKIQLIQIEIDGQVYTLRDVKSGEVYRLRNHIRL